MSMLFGGTILIAWMLLFFLPCIIARKRDVPYQGLLFLGTMLFGWTASGWFIGLVYACTAYSRERHLVYVLPPGSRMEPPPLRYHRYVAIIAAVLSLAMFGQAQAKPAGWFVDFGDGICRAQDLDAPIYWERLQHNSAWQTVEHPIYVDGQMTSLTVLAAGQMRGRLHWSGITFFRQEADCRSFIGRRPHSGIVGGADDD